MFAYSPTTRYGQIKIANPLDIIVSSEAPKLNVD